MTTENEFSEAETGAFPDLDSCRFETEVRGTVLRGTWSAPVHGAARGDLLIHHGHGEHSGRYGHVANFFSRNGWRVWVYDMRGHGQSMGPRGDVGGYGDLLGDLEAVIGRCMGEHRPFFLLGHSLGGQVVLRAAQEWETAGSEIRNAGERCLGVISASPYLRLAFSPGKWQRTLAHLARRVLPGWTTRSPVRASDLSRDEAWLRAMPGAALIHDRISARMFFEIEKTARGLLESGLRIRWPLLLLHGGEDRITSVEASRAFWNRSKVGRGSEFRVYEQFRHELFNERGREGVLREVLVWMEARLGAAGTGGGRSGDT